MQLYALSIKIEFDFTSVVKNFKVHIHINHYNDTNKVADLLKDPYYPEKEFNSLRLETILVPNELDYTKKELKNIKKQTRAECDQRQNGANGKKTNRSQRNKIKRKIQRKKSGRLSWKKL